MILETPFKNIFNLCVKLLFVSTILSLGSCLVRDEEDLTPTGEDLRIELESIAQGHQFIYFKEQNVIGPSLGGNTTLYYDTVPVDSSRSPFIETRLDYYNYPKLLHLKPNTEYYLQAYYRNVVSSMIKVKTLSAPFACTPTPGKITGTFAARQNGFDDLVMYPDRLIGNLSGDFVKCSFRMTDNWAGLKEGIYTTVSPFQEHDYESNIHNMMIFVDAIDTKFYARKDQAVRLIKKVNEPGFDVQFCDMVFEDDTGRQILLSGYLE